jgi:hypothetical protein
MQTISQIIREVKRLREEVNQLKQTVDSMKPEQEVVQESVQESEVPLAARRGRPRKVT